MGRATRREPPRGAGQPTRWPGRGGHRDDGPGGVAIRPDAEPSRRSGPRRCTSLRGRGGDDVSGDSESVNQTRRTCTSAAEGVSGVDQSVSLRRQDAVGRAAGRTPWLLWADPSRGAWGPSLLPSDRRRGPPEFHGPHEVMGEGVPQHDRPRFLEPSDRDVAEAPVAGDGVHALGGRGPLLVGRPWPRPCPCGCARRPPPASRQGAADAGRGWGLVAWCGVLEDRPQLVLRERVDLGRLTKPSSTSIASGARAVAALELVDHRSELALVGADVATSTPTMTWLAVSAANWTL